MIDPALEFDPKMSCADRQSTYPKFIVKTWPFCFLDAPVTFAGAGALTRLGSLLTLLRHERRN